MTYEQAKKLITRFARVETRITQKAAATEREAAEERKCIAELIRGLTDSVSPEQINEVVREIS